MKKYIILIGILMTILSTEGAIKSEDHLITHKNSLLAFNLSIYEEALKTKSNLSMPLDEAKALLKELSQFDLGRFLLTNKGLNGFWTAYIIIHGPQKKDISPLEHFLLHKAPSVKATQERFQIFKNILQSNLTSNTTIASLPCGVMDDLLGLDYSYVENIKITGIDLDGDSLEYAKKNAMAKKIDQEVSFLQKDAWSLDQENAYDLITSNGLNIYEPNDDQVIALYKSFYKALKPEGKLVISFLTPPPILDKNSPWKNYDIEDALKQRLIFSDIIGAHWQAFRSEEKTRHQLETAEFNILEIIYDSQGIFPTVVAQKGWL